MPTSNAANNVYCVWVVMTHRVTDSVQYENADCGEVDAYLVRAPAADSCFVANYLSLAAHALSPVHLDEVVQRALSCSNETRRIIALCKVRVMSTKMRCSESRELLRYVPSRARARPCNSSNVVSFPTATVQKF